MTHTEKKKIINMEIRPSHSHKKKKKICTIFILTLSLSLWFDLVGLHNSNVNQQGVKKNPLDISPKKKKKKKCSILRLTLP